MPDVNSISTTYDPYSSTRYTAKSNSKNTLTITNFIQLLAVQLQNQDMTNPMDNSEMMNQMTQMAMVQALSTMTETMTAGSAMDMTVYAAGLMGKEVTVAVMQENANGTLTLAGSKKGVIESVNLSGSAPTFRLKDDDTDYPLAYLMGLGDVTDSVENGNESGTDLT
ncbi:MAG: flagellar hook capping protein [Lachnospiraceae bacterium]|nr:flagellar hook capping protein [Lachnospiraceae bacterium]